MNTVGIISFEKVEISSLRFVSTLKETIQNQERLAAEAL